MRTTIDKLIGEEAGQAAVEYLLLLVVVVGVILGSLYQFNSAFSVWADNYFGDYLACLIESGELPSLGGSAGESAICSQLYKPFSISEGRGPLVGDGMGGGGENSQSGDSDSASNSSTPSYSGGGGASVVQGGGNKDSSSGRFGGARRFRANRSSLASGSEKKDGSGTAMGGVTDLSGYEKGKAVRMPLSNAEQFGKGGRRFLDKDKDRKSNMKVAAAKEGEGKRPQETRIKINRRDASSTSSTEIEELTFGKFFRYLLIAAIIIAVIIFIGGQVMQVSKSMD